MKSLIVGCAILMFVGCDSSRQKEGSNSPNAIKILSEAQQQLAAEMLEIKNRQKGEEFRNLSMAIPIGKDGKLRIVVPRDDEGKDLYTPSEFDQALFDEAVKKWSVASRSFQALEKEQRRSVPAVPVPSTPVSVLPVPANVVTEDNLASALEAIARSQVETNSLLRQQADFFNGVFAPKVELLPPPAVYCPPGS